MQNRNIDEITDEIVKIKSIIDPMKDYLSSHPDDLSVQANVDNLNDRLNQLYFKLNSLKTNMDCQFLICICLMSVGEKSN